MINFFLIKHNGALMIKYHNNLNKIALKDFNQRELGIFFAVCSIMKEQGIKELNISFSDLEKLIGIPFKDKNELVINIRSTNKKLLNLKTETSNNGVYIDFVLFRTFITDTNNNMLTIKVNEDFAYILNDLTQNFTLFDLKEFNLLSSIYAKHLYRLLKQFRYTGYYKVEINEFRRLFDIPSSYQMNDIDKRVLKPAIKEVSAFFNSLMMNKIKEGRKIKYLEFKFSKEQRSSIVDNTIDVPITIENPAVIEQRKADVLCPKCGKPLVLLYNKNGDTFWGHADYLVNTCKETYSTKEEIEIIKEQRAVLLEDEADRAKFEQEVTELIDQHKDIVNLISFEKRYVCIEQIEQQDLFYRNPVMRIKIDRDAIDTIKKYIEEWSK